MKRTYLAIAFLCLSITLIFPTVGFASSYEPGAKTSPPPSIFLPFTSFDPNFIYLENGKGDITNIGNGKIAVSGYSSATQYVDTIGIKLIVQKWTGSVWEDYNIGTELTQSDELDVYTSKQINVDTGYYYRVRSIHWAIHKGVREQGDRYSSSILIK